MLPKYIEKNYKFNNYRDALKKAENLSCVGTHTEGGSYYPCKNADALFKAAYSVQYDTLVPSSFETVDMALYDWLDKIIDIFATRNDGWRKVPIIWLTQERAFQIKDNREMRELGTESLKFPLISVERTSIKQTAVNDSPIPARLFADGDGTTLVIAKKIKQSKTKNFANATSLRLYKQNNFKFKSKKIVYEYVTVPLPIYHDFSYTINLRAEYQQQINDMIQPFAAFNNNINQFMISNSGHSYETFLQTDFGITNNISSLANSEKIYESKIQVRVIGYIMGAGPNQKGPQVARRENFVEVRFPREHVMVGDINEFSEEGYRP
tara:strand:+ start:13311 stop:14279 length:969 start_codon:yes stop_codon:yes gene_type:complete